MTSLKDDTKVVVAIDFGTMFSGYAYAHRTNPNEITVEDKWEGGFKGCKTPTIIKYQDDYSTVESWGFSALPEKLKKPKKGRNDQSDQSKSIELFKLFLLKDLKEKPSLPGKLTYRKVITDYLKKLDEMIKGKLDTHNWPNFDFYRNVLIILTIPVEFDDDAIAIMRDCAFNAGLIKEKESSDLIFTTELEAAAIHCLNSTEENNLKPGVVDCGGGTVNLTSYELLTNNGISEITEFTSGNCGSSLIDKIFLEFLRYKLGNAVFKSLEEKHYNLLQYLIQEFCDEVKIPFTGEKSDFQQYEIFLEDYYPLKDIIEEARGQGSLKEAKINVEFSDVEGMFDPLIEKIISLIRGQLGQLAQQPNKKCSAIMLVGGFSESKYLQARIEKEFNEIVSNISVPTQPMTAILKGGVQFGFQAETVVVNRLNRDLKRKHGKSIPDDPVYPQIKHDEEIFLIGKLFISEQKYKELDTVYNQLKNKYENLEEHCEDLNKTLVDQIILNQKLQDDNSKLIKPLVETLEKKNNEICEVTKKIQEKNKEIQAKDEDIQAKYKEIQAKDKEIQAKDKEIQAKDKVIQAKYKEIQAKDKEIQADDEEIQATYKEIQAKDKLIQAKDEEIKVKDEEIQAKDKEIQAKDKEVQERDREIQAKDKVIQAKNEEIQVKDEVIQVKDEEIQVKDRGIQVKNKEIQAKNKEIQIKNKEIRVKDEETRDLLQKNAELQDEAYKYQLALGSATNLSDNSFTLKNDILHLQYSLEDYITRCKGNVKINIPKVQGLLKKYGSKSVVTADQKSLIKAVLQRHVIEQIFEYANEYFNHPKYYQELYGIEANVYTKAKQLTDIAKVFAERRIGVDGTTKVLPIKLRQQIFGALGNRGFNDMVDNNKNPIPHKFINHFQGVLNNEIGKYRTLNDPKKKQEVEKMAGSIIQKVVVLFWFRLEVQEPIADCIWFNYNDNIDPNYMEGKWDEEEIDMSVDICYFPLIAGEFENKSKYHVYTRAKILQKYN